MDEDMATGVEKQNSITNTCRWLNQTEKEGWNEK